jgi:ATP synthase I chain
MERADHAPEGTAPEEAVPGSTTPAQLAAYAGTEKRISWLTLAFGCAATIVAVALRQPAWAEGLAIGAMLAWLNFRWLRRGLDALVHVATAQEGATEPRIPVGTWFRLLFRYGLIALCVYVIFELLRIPLVSMVLGLCALGAATVAASVYEIVRPTE